MRKRLLLPLLLTISTLQTLHAQWNADPSINTAISTGSTKSAYSSWVVSDGRKGFYIAWQQSLSSSANSDIYLQHLNEQGFPLWPVNGIRITDVPNVESDPKVINDGDGGAYVIWHDTRANTSEDIYAQRVDANGNALWAANGIRITSVSGIFNLDPQVIPDGTGGFIVCWWGQPPAGNAPDVYAQRVDRNGNKLWVTDGVDVCTAPGKQLNASLVSDGNGGAIITWDDNRNDPSNLLSDIYAQRITGNGLAAWTANGVAVCTAPDNQKDVQLTTDGNGGVIVTWSDYRHRTPANNIADIYAQRVNSNGTMAWTLNGNAVSVAGGVQKWPMITDDDNGGAIICFYDTQNAGQAAIYAQKIGGDGMVKWLANGVSASHYPGQSAEFGGFIVKDGSGGAIIGWQHPIPGAGTDIYAQHLTSIGIKDWGMEGLPVCTAPASQVFSQVEGIINEGWMIADEGTAVLAWADYRNSAVDIYATRIYVKPPMPIIENTNDQCITSAMAIGKLANPPISGTITVMLDGALLTYNPTDSTFIYFTTGLATGEHKIEVRYTNIAGSTDAEETYLVVDQFTPVIEISTPSPIVCTGVATDFLTIVSDAGTNPQYQWQVNGVNVNSNGPRWSTNTLQDGDVVSCILTVDASLTCATTTTSISNTVTMTVIDGSSPAVAVSVSDNDICPGTRTTFTALPAYAGTNPSYQWQVNGTNVGSNSPTWSSDNLDDADLIECVITPGTGACTHQRVRSNTITMDVVALPIVSLTPADTLVKYGNQIILNATIVGSFQSYTWSPATGLVNSTLLTPLSVPVTDDAEYILTVISDGGCVIVKKSSIKLLSGLYIPTGFTPNGDGLNDVFRIPPRTLQKLKRFSIYNRWGNLVFATSDIGAGWDGYIKGSLADAGVYVYIIEGHDGLKNVSLKGAFTLVR